MKELNAEEIKEVVRTAQIYSREFTAEQYQKLMGMHRELAEPGFIEAAYGVLRLEEEYGIPCSQAPAEYAQIMKNIGKMESEAARFKKVREGEEMKLTEASQALDRLKTEQSHQEKGLAAFRTRAAAEKKGLEEDLAEARKKAGIDKQDIVSAVEMKALAASHGLDLELVLRLGEEFAHDVDAANKLALAVTEGRTQLEAREAWQKENESLKVEVEEKRTKCEQLKRECLQAQETLSRLQADLANEDRLRRFHQRYQGHVKILEHLAARWDEIVPVRCLGPFCQARFWVSRGPSNFRAYHVCPCCGLGPLEYDRDAVAEIGLSDKGTIEVKLGGNGNG